MQAIQNKDFGFELCANVGFVCNGTNVYRVAPHHTDYDRLMRVIRTRCFKAKMIATATEQKTLNQFLDCAEFANVAIAPADKNAIVRFAIREIEKFPSLYTVWKGQDMSVFIGTDENGEKTIATSLEPLVKSLVMNRIQGWVND